MQMRINQSWNDSAALKIDHSRLWAGELPYVRDFAYGLDLPIVNGDGFLNGKLRVDGKDLAVDEDHVCNLGRCQGCKHHPHQEEGQLQLSQITQGSISLEVHPPKTFNRIVLILEK